MNFSGLVNEYGRELLFTVLALGIGVPLVSLVISLSKFLISLKIPINKSKIEGRHILVVGASAGLGKDFALQLGGLGAKRITLVARGTDKDDKQKSRLDYAVEECKANSPSGVSVACLKLDVSNTEAVKTAMEDLLSKTGRVDWVVICSGSSVPRLIAADTTQFSLDPEVKMMDVNYYGSVNVIRALLAIGGASRPQVFPERIVTVGTVANGCPMAGFAAYCASKAALRAFSDCLRNERFFYGNVKVHHFMPGSMDTPGFEEENKIKPRVTRLIEGASDLYSSSQAAKALLTGITNETYVINNDPIGFLTRVGIQSISPRDWPILEVFYAPLTVLIGEIFCFYFDYVSQKCAREEAPKKI